MASTAMIPDARSPARKLSRVVLACTDLRSQEVLISVLRQRGLEPILSSSVSETKLLLAKSNPALVISQARFDDGDFRDLLEFAARQASKVPIIICADFYDPSLYLDAMELGAFDYFAYPYHREGVEWVVSNALNEALNHNRAPGEWEHVTRESRPC